jgi:hypothetical protein
MIQGTATLEDLLQLVRQKKAPLKEAAELLEQSIDEWFGKKEEKKLDPTKSAVGRTLRGKEAIYNQHTDDLEKYAKRADGATGHRAEVNAQRAADAERKAAEANKDFRHTKGEYLDLLKKRGLTNPQAHAMLRAAIGEAFEILECMINELHPDTVHKALDKRTDQSIEADDKDREEFGKILNIKDRDARIKAYTDFKKRTNDRFDKEGKKLDLYVNYVKRHPGELKIEEALELMEDLTAQILKQPAEKRASLFYKLKQGLDKDTRDSYTKAQEEEKQKSKEEKGQEKTEQRKKYRGKSIEDWKQGRLMDQIARNAKNLGKLNDPATAKAIRRHDSKIGEALELMEEIISEVSVGALARATENNFNKRREVAKDSTEKAKKAYDSYEKQSKEHPEDEEALYKAVSKLGNAAHKDREKASHANDLANLNLPKDSKVPANKLFNAADKTYKGRGKEVDKALEKGKGRGDKEFDSSMKKYARAVDLAVADPVVSRRTNEALEEVLSVLEKFTEGDKKEAARKVIDSRKREYLSKYANVLDAADIDGSDNVPDGDLKDLDRAEKRYKHAEEVAKKLDELFDRPDLLDDIDTMLGSPVKKAKDKLLKQIFEPKKEKKEEKKTKKETCKACESFDKF